MTNGPSPRPLDALKRSIPGYAKDIRLNLSSVLGTSTLPEQQLWGAALGVAIASRGEHVRRAIDAEARGRLSAGAYQAALAAAAVMAMNTVYYRAVHLIGDPAYAELPARLRMQAIATYGGGAGKPSIGDPGVDTADFELWCLAISAVHGCARCLQAHERALRDKGVARESVQEAIRIAAVVHAAAVTLETQTDAAAV